MCAGFATFVSVKYFCHLDLAYSTHLTICFRGGTGDSSSKDPVAHVRPCIVPPMPVALNAVTPADPAMQWHKP